MRTTKLDTNLLKDFASTAKGGAVSRPTSVTMKGTIVMQGDKIYVKIDGSDNLTPVVTTAQVVDGDRVMVTISNHVATVIGNVTAPAITRAGKMYMQMTDEGLEVGKVNDDNAIVGLHVLIADDGYYIVSDDGTILAYFKGREIQLGPPGGTFATIKFSGNRGSILMDNDILAIKGETAVGLRQGEYGSTRAEVVAKYDGGSPKSGIQVYSGNTLKTAVVAGNSGLDISIPSTGYARINGADILRSNTLLKTGTISSTATIGANKNKTITATINTLPDGFSLVGISEIRTNHANICRMTQFVTHPSKNQVGATFVNVSGSSTSLTVNMEWFALRSGKAQSGTGAVEIKWSADYEDILLEDEPES